MATISPVVIGGAGRKTIPWSTLSGSDVLVYTRGLGQILIVYNTTGGTIAAATLTGSAAPSNYNAPGGPLAVDLTTGYPVSTSGLTAGASRYIQLDTIAEYLAGTVTITGGTNCVAVLLTPI